MKVQKVISPRTNERTVFCLFNLKLLRFPSLCKKSKTLNSVTVLNRKFSSCREDPMIRSITDAARLRNVYFWRMLSRCTFARHSVVEVDISYHTTLDLASFACANRNPTSLNQIQPPEPPPTGKAILCLPCARPLLTPLQLRTHVMYSGTWMSYKLPPLPRGLLRLCICLLHFSRFRWILLSEVIRAEERGSCLPRIRVSKWYVREIYNSLDTSSRNLNRNVTY